MMIRDDRATLRAPETLPAHHVEAVTAAVAESQRPATRRAYAAMWRQFREWTKGEGLSSLPAEPLTVAAYLVHRDACGRSASTLAMDLRAIGHHHRAVGLPSPTTSDAVRRTAAGLRNKAVARGRAKPRQARGLTAAHLEAIRETAHLPRSGPSGRTEMPDAARRRGDLDIALIAVMRDALLRRGEATALRWGDVDFRSDGTSRVTIRRSKTSNSSAVLYVGVRATGDLKRIRPEGADPKARVFGFRRGRTASCRIAAAARAAGLGEGFSGHSPRVGMAQDLTASGAGLVAIMVAGRWKSERMPAHYSRKEAVAGGAVARYYG